VTLRELERDVQASRAVYESFLVRARETGEQERLDTKNIRIISRADLPLRRSFPPSNTILALAALILGFVVCLPFSNTTEGATLATHGGILKTLFGSISTHMHGADLAYPVGILVAGITYVLLTYRSPRVTGTQQTAQVKGP